MLLDLFLFAGMTGSLLFSAYLLRSRSKADREVKDVWAMTESILDAIPVPVYLRNLEGRLIISNKAHLNLIGRTREEVVGKTVFDLYAPEEAEQFASLDRQIVEGGVEKISEQVFSDPKGNVHYLITTKDLYRNEEGVVEGLIGVSLDVTEQKKLEQELREAHVRAEDASRAKSAFLATMSHEIRTPMNGVIGMTELLKQTSLNAEQKEYISIIQSSGELLLSLINDILDYSKFESGNVELDKCSTALPELIQDSMEIFAVKAATNGIELGMSLDHDVPHAISTDPLRLRQILVNLLSNAVKFTEKGEIFVRVSSDSRQGSVHQLHFEVHDTGIGIPVEKQAAIFDPFAQADASTTRKYGGTGLGLAICKRLCELMGGKIWVESTPGQGAVFHFTIQAKAEQATHDILKSIRSDLQGRTILLVDDNATNRLVLQGTLERQGAIVESFEKPAMALKRLLEENPPDVAILDMQMPEMDGVMLAQQIRAHKPLEKLPLMLLSSIMDRPPSGIFDAVVTKPAAPTYLIEILSGLLAPKQNASSEAADSSSVFGTPSNLRILVAEDNIVNQKVILLNLARLGYRADLAADGVEAVEKAGHSTYDLILMDIQMPRMDGLEATRRIREKGPNAQSRIVALTAGAMESEKRHALDSGMDDFLAKPITVTELRRVLRQG